MLFHLRPHHLICNLCFRGKGYNEEFTENLRIIHQALKKRHNKIKIVQGIDDICLQCPTKQENTCKSEAFVGEIDRAYLKILQLKYGETITVYNMEKKIKNYLSLEKFHTACEKCSWKASGICEAIIRESLLILPTPE